MTSFQYETSATFDASIEAVWDFVVGRDDWRLPYFEPVSRPGNGALTVGSRAEWAAVVGDYRMPMVDEITVHDPPRHLQWRQVNVDVPLVAREGNYLFESFDGRTRFTVRHTFDSAIPGADIFVPWIMDSVVSPAIMRNIAEGVERRTSG